MDENHQDTVNNNLTTTNDIKWVVSKKSKLLVPQRTKQTGFENKTRWDRIQLFVQVIGAFAIPLSIIGLILSILQFNAQQNYAFQISIDQQQQTTLETYINNMSELLLSNNLIKSKPGDGVRSLARVRTFTALQYLNPVRKGILLEFLYQAGLIDKSNPIVNLHGADLSNVDLSTTFVGNAQGGVSQAVDLTGADLSGAFLAGAKLQDTVLRDADLSNAILDYADLQFVDLQYANLDDASLYSTNLHLANLNYANLSGADLARADLSYAILSNANLSFAWLVAANLNSSEVTKEQLAQARSLKGATMPDGSIHP